MKKIILAVLMVVMVATPCFAQEVETEGIFSIEGTLWSGCETGCTKEVGDGPPECDFSCEGTTGFYQGKMYSCNETRCLSYSTKTYFDSPLISIVNFRTRYDVVGMRSYILQPSGFGVYTELGCYERFPYLPFPTTRYCYFGIGIYFKVDNNWSPYDQTIVCMSNNDCPEEMVCVDGNCQ